MVTTVLIFIIILAVLVLTHEFGHFIVAKKSGMRVDEFGFGFPPRIASIKKKETRYSFNLFPIGGFVKIFGEDGGDKDNDRSFASKAIWKRMLVISAGIIVNFLLAFLLFSASHMMGTTVVISDEHPADEYESVFVQIAEVALNSPAQNAGIKIGDKIEKLESATASISVETVLDVQEFISQNLGETVVFTVIRGNETLDLSTQIREVAPEGEGATGIALVRAGVVSYPWYSAIVEGAKTFWFVLVGTLFAFGGMIKGLVVSGSLPSDISGPVGIAYMTGTVRDLGFVYLLQFVALISLNLGIINLIPFPALDGGRLLFLGIEKIKGSPVPKKVEGMAHAIGFALLILLIIVITLKDINRFF